MKYFTSNNVQYFKINSLAEPFLGVACTAVNMLMTVICYK